MTSRCLQLRPVAALALGLLGILPFPLRAAAPPAAPAAPVTAAAETFSESIQVSVVDLDVFVTDKAGKPVTGLRKEDFTVLEDGKPVEVSNFFAENGRTAAAASAAGSRIPSATAAAPGSTDQRLRLVVFIDDVNFSVANRSRILESVGTFLHTELKPGDEAMIVRYDEKLVVRQPFTSDLARLDADLAAIRLLPSDVRKFNASYIQAVEELVQSINGGEGFGALAEASVSNWASQESSAVRGALNALDSVVSSLAGVPGRKTLLYVSDGLPLVPGLELFTLISRNFRSPEADKRTPGMVAQRFDLTPRFRQITSHASRNRITFYPIESYGTRDGASSQYTTERLMNRHNGLRVLALETGGRELFNATNVPAALARMEQDLTTYYSLGYQPQRAGDEAEHKIEVRVKARNADLVRYRRWYRDKPVGEAVAERTLAAMRFGGEENPLGASVEVVPGKKAGETLVRVKVPLAKIYLEPRGDSRQGHLRLYVVASGEGQTTSVRETKLATVTVPEAEAASGKMQDYTHEIAIPLPPGSYVLGLGVRDEQAVTTSYLHKDFKVAPQRPLSSRAPVLSPSRSTPWMRR
jgi:VWFA-related protein